MRFSAAAAWLALLALVEQLLTSSGARPTRAERLTSTPLTSERLSCRLSAKPSSLLESRVLDPDFTVDDVRSLYLGDQQCKRIPNRARYILRDHRQRKKQQGRNLQDTLLKGWADTLFSGKDDFQQQEQFSIAFRLNKETADHWEAVVTVHDDIARSHDLYLCQRPCEGACGDHLPPECVAQLAFVAPTRHLPSQMFVHSRLLENGELTPQIVAHSLEFCLFISLPVFCLSVIQFAWLERGAAKHAEQPESLLPSVRSTWADLYVEVFYAAFCALGSVAVGVHLMLNKFGDNRTREKVAIAFPVILLYVLGMMYLGIFRRAQLHTALLSRSIVLELDVMPKNTIVFMVVAILLSVFISSPAGIGDAVLSLLPLAPAVFYVFWYLFECMSLSRAPRVDGTVDSVPGMQLKPVVESRYRSDPESYDQETQQAIEHCRPPEGSNVCFIALLVSMGMFLASSCMLYTENQESVLHYCTFARGTLLSEWSEDLHTTTLTLDSHITRLRLQCQRSKNSRKVAGISELNYGLTPEPYHWGSLTTIYFSLEPGDLRPLHVQLTLAGPKARPYNVHVLRSLKVGRLHVEGAVSGAVSPWVYQRHLDDFNTSSVIYAPNLEPRLQVSLAMRQIFWGPISPAAEVDRPARSAATCAEECRDAEGWLHCVACYDVRAGGCVYLRGDHAGEAEANKKSSSAINTSSWCAWEKNSFTCSPLLGDPLMKEFEWLYEGAVAHQYFSVRMQKNSDTLEALEFGDTRFRIELAAPIPEVRFPLAMRVYSSAGFPVHDLGWGADAATSTSYDFALGTPESLAAGISVPALYKSTFEATVDVHRGQVLVAVKARHDGNATPWCADWCNAFEPRITMPIDGKLVDFTFTPGFGAVLCRAIADGDPLDVSTLISEHQEGQKKKPTAFGKQQEWDIAFEKQCAGHTNLVSAAMAARNIAVAQFLLEVPGLSHWLNISASGGRETLERADTLSKISGLGELDVDIKGLLGTRACVALMKSLRSHPGLERLSLNLDIQDMDEICLGELASSLTSLDRIKEVSIDMSTLRGDFSDCRLVEELGHATGFEKVSIKFGPASTDCSASSLAAGVASWGNATQLDLDYERGNLTSDAVLPLLQALRHVPGLRGLELRVPALVSWNANMSAAFEAFLEQARKLVSLKLFVPGNSSDPTFATNLLKLLPGDRGGRKRSMAALDLNMQALYNDDNIEAWKEFLSNTLVLAKESSFRWYLNYVSASKSSDFRDGMMEYLRRAPIYPRTRQHHDIFFGPDLNEHPVQYEDLIDMVYLHFSDLNFVFAPTPPLDHEGGRLVQVFKKNCPWGLSRRISMTLPAGMDVGDLCDAFAQCGNLESVSLKIAGLLNDPPAWDGQLQRCAVFGNYFANFELLTSQEELDNFLNSRGTLGRRLAQQLTWRVVPPK